MLATRKILISALLSLSILTTTVTANDGLKCSNGKCYINVKNFGSSKNMPKKTNTFKNHSKFLTPLDKSLQIEDNSHLEIDTFRFAHSKYVKQENEALEPLTQEEMNTIFPAPEKFVGTLEEQELYYEQQREMGIELIKPSLPMSLYYCKNDTDPIYDEKAEQFNCIVSS